MIAHVPGIVPTPHLQTAPSPRRSSVPLRVGKARSTGYLVLKSLAIVGVIAAVAAGASAADARSRYAGDQAQNARGLAFDGKWSVLIETERGACDRSYRVGLDIVNGAVTFGGSPYGRVSATGVVRVSVDMGDQQAQGDGRLSRASGKGVWRGVGKAGGCSGRWMAERRD